VVKKGKVVVKGKVVENGRDVVVVKGKKADMTTAVKKAQIDETTIYLEDVQKPWYIPALRMVGYL
jgi:acyl-coenzyme A thioesterase PaaI-like protein